MSTHFRIRFSLQGGHVHCRLFVASDPRLTHANAGSFVLSAGDEFRDFAEQFNSAELLPDDDSQGGLVDCFKGG